MKVFNSFVRLVILGFFVFSNVANSKSKQLSLDVPPLSVQLWSVRDFVKEDFNGTLGKLAELGFKGVEFAGDYGPYKDNPAKLKSFLDSLML